MASAADVETAARVLRQLAEAGEVEAVDARNTLIPLMWRVINKHAERRPTKGRRARRERPPRTDAPNVEPAPPVPCDVDAVRLTDSKHISRLLYPNPVCFLTTWDGARDPAESSAVSVMTISWLTALDNDGHFLLSLNQRRHTASLLAARRGILCLSIAAAGLEPMLTRVGSCSGREFADKPKACGVPLCAAGWGRAEADDGGDTWTEADGATWPEEGEVTMASWTEAEGAHAAARAVAVAPCVAHIVGRVEHATAVHGHFVLRCAALRAHVRSDYWSGATLGPRAPDLPPILTFLGSRTFGYVRATSGLEEGDRADLTASPS